MADSEDLNLLMSGETDLSRCDFRDANLSGMDLRRRNFTHCLLEKANCEGALFDGSNFEGAKVSFMKAADASFDGCNLTGLHFGYTDLSRASFRNSKLVSARFQHANLTGAKLQGALVARGAVDADTQIDGVQVDDETNFEGLKVLRPTSRNSIFAGYTFREGALHRGSDAPKAVAMVDTGKEELSGTAFPVADKVAAVAFMQIRVLMQNAVVTRITAQQFATQIEECLRTVPATNGNEIAEPLQTMLEFASVLRMLAPSNESHFVALNQSGLEARVSELETLVSRLSDQLADETKARRAAEELLANDGFVANFRRSAGKAAGLATVTAGSAIVTVGVPAAAIYFLGAEHPVVTGLLTAVRRLKE